MRAKALLIIPVLLIALLVAACAGSAPSEAAAPAAGEGHQEASGSGHGASGPESTEAVVVPVEVGEWYVRLSQTTFKVGVPYRFVVTNSGQLPHELMIMPPVDPSSGMSMEEMDEMAVAMVEEDDLGPGTTASVEVTFEQTGSARLEAACHLPGHYEAGMKQPLTVVAK